MKRLISILIWIMLIVCACQPVAPTSEPSQTEMPAPLPPPTPEATQSATPTATEVAGPVEGQTRMKEGVGEQVYTVIKDKDGNVMFAEWVRVKADWIPLWDSATDKYLGYDQQGIIEVYCSDKFEGCASVPKFTHQDLLNEEHGPGITGRLSPIITDRLGITGKLFDYKVSHPNGLDFNFFLTDPEHPLTWTMRPEPHTSVVEILTDWDDPILEGGQDVRISTSLTLRSRILGVDQDGRLIGVVALNELPPEGAAHDAWRADVWNSVIFLHSAMVLQQEDVANIKNHTVLSEIMDAATRNNIQWVIQQPDN
jgi:hypothetical protein